MRVEGEPNYRVDEAVLYLIGNGIDPRDIDKDSLAEIDAELKANPCEVRLPVITEPTDPVVIPQEGRARELLNDFFGKRGIAPEDAPPVILGMATRIAHKIVQQESAFGVGSEVSQSTNMQSGAEYTL